MSTELNPSSNTLEEFFEEDMVSYEGDTSVSSIYGHSPATTPVRDSTSIAPNPTAKREEVYAPLA
uniref:Pheromone n=1 Tax=Peronospora matthiolae TaxID=2874970 RepID=A0AAV1VHU0_9STRA